MNTALWYVSVRLYLMCDFVWDILFPPGTIYEFIAYYIELVVCQLFKAVSQASCQSEKLLKVLQITGQMIDTTIAPVFEKGGRGNSIILLLVQAEAVKVDLAKAKGVETEGRGVVSRGAFALKMQMSQRTKVFFSRKVYRKKRQTYVCLFLCFLLLITK